MTLKLFSICLLALFASSVFGAAKPGLLTTIPWAYTAPAAYTAGIAAPPAAYTAGYFAPFASTYNAYTLAHTAAVPAAYTSAPVFAAGPAFYHAAPYVAPTARFVASAPAASFVAAPSAVPLLRKKK